MIKKSKNDISKEYMMKLLLLNVLVGAAIRLNLKTSMAATKSLSVDTTAKNMLILQNINELGITAIESKDMPIRKDIYTSEKHYL